MQVAVILYGCTGPADSITKRSNTQSTARKPAAGVILADVPPSGSSEPVNTVIDARPAALVDGKIVTWGELRPGLNELAGAETLQEIILDRKLSAALLAAGITVSPDDIAGERKMLLESLNDDPNTAMRLLDELRDRQSLGKTRFEALMRRNASLRALVRSQVKISDEAIANMQDMLHGPKRQARIIVTTDLGSAQAAINLVKSGVSFIDVAVEMSTDSSAARGGLLEPISMSDPKYPQALRQTLWSLNPGEMSGPVLLDNRYAIVMLVKRVSADGVSMDDARPSLERMVRISQERLLMDQMARSLMANTTVTVFDDSLNESWTRRKRATIP